MAVTAAVIGALGALGGGAISAFGGKKPKKTKRIDQNNPLYNAILIEALTQMGVPVPEGLMLQASPLRGLRGIKPQEDIQIQTLIEQGIAAGLSDSDIAKQIANVGRRTNSKGELTGSSIFYDPKGKLKGRYSKLGISSLDELVAQQRAYLDYANTTEARNRDLSQLTADARRSALEAISRIQGDFVAPSEADILARGQEQSDILRAQIARERADAEQGILTQASAAGINPAARLGRLDEWQAMSNLASGPEGLARALQLLSGEQGVQANALAALQSSLGQGTGNAMNVLGLQNSLGQQAAAQALALSNYRQGQANALGAGFSGALGSIAGALLNTGNNNDLLARLIQLQGGQAAAPGEPVDPMTGQF